MELLLTMTGLDYQQWVGEIIVNNDDERVELLLAMNGWDYY